MMGKRIGSTRGLRRPLFLIILFVGICAQSVRADHVEVTNDRAVLRAEPASASERIRGLTLGERLNLRTANTGGGNWLPVFDPTTGRDAWVYRSFVRMHTGDAPGVTLPSPSPTPAPSPTPPPTGNLVPGADHPGLPRAFYVVEETFYTACFDPRLKIPLWVQYTLRASDLDGSADRTGLDFVAHESVPEMFQARDTDYAGTVYAKGHMAPAEDMARSDLAMLETFFYTNAAPQLGPKFNGSKWSVLERKTREWVRARGELVVVMGPIFDLAPPDETPGTAHGAEEGWVKFKTMGESRVAIAHGFFRVIYDPEQFDALAFLLPHQDVTGSTNPVTKFVVTIDEIEARAGIDLFPELPVNSQNVLEAKRANTLWAGVDGNGADIDPIPVPQN